jgi:hypothetical protein
MTQEATSLMFPTATKADVTRDNVVFQIAQSYRLIDSLAEILQAEGQVDPEHVSAVIGAFSQQLDEMSTIVAVQNEITVGEYEGGVHALHHFYEDQIRAMAEELLAQAQAGQ